MTWVIVDAENVRRSCWPNLSPQELVTPTRAWAQREGRELLIVFDGEPPEQAPDLVGAGYADDEIARLAHTRTGPVWVVTSDRALRARLTRVERVLGGGEFLRAALQA
jgi:hypothetical protein